MQIKIIGDLVGQRLDKLLTQIQTKEQGGQALSRSQIQKKIKTGDVLVNGRMVTPHYFLKKNDEIIIASTNKPVNKKNQSKITDQAKRPIPQIIADEKDYLIINKPPGLTVHGGLGITEKTLIDWLLEKYPQTKQIGEDPIRPGIVHRLDKEASGLMVIAKNQTFYDHIKQQFAGRKITKKYLALVHGKILKKSGEINFPIARSIKKGRMAALPLNQIIKNQSQGKKAITEYQITSNFINYTLLKLQIKTGRTHQIRVHLAAIDHPIVGDKIYGATKAKLKNKRLLINRLFLVAAELGFENLAGQAVAYQIELPPELKSFLTIIK